MIANRVDANQSAIVAALRKFGATVQPLNSIKAGCPDLLVGYQGKNYLMEVKDGTKTLSRLKLTPAEKNWHHTWRGTVYIVYSAHDALDLLRWLTR